MRSFGVDLGQLEQHATRLGASEPFGPLADAAPGLITIDQPTATAAALQRFVDRLRVDLSMLSEAAGSLSRLTRRAADDYRSVETSIVPPWKR